MRHAAGRHRSRALAHARPDLPGVSDGWLKFSDLAAALPWTPLQPPREVALRRARGGESLSLSLPLRGELRAGRLPPCRARATRSPSPADERSCCCAAAALNSTAAREVRALRRLILSIQVSNVRMGEVCRRGSLAMVPG